MNLATTSYIAYVAMLLWAETGTIFKGTFYPFLGAPTNDAKRPSEDKKTHNEEWPCNGLAVCLCPDDNQTQGTSTYAGSPLTRTGTHGVVAQLQNIAL